MIKEFLTTFTAQFVALDIIGAVPIYFSLTHRMTMEERTAIVNKSMIVATIVSILFMFAGQSVFHHLGIGIFDFKIAGGLVLLLMAFAELSGNAEAHHTSGSTGIVPLAVPLIAGPAVLTTLIVHAAAFGYFVTGLALLLNFGIAWLVLKHSEKVKRVFGKDGTTAISKIAALLLAAISVAMIRSGVFEAINAWNKTN